MRNKFMSCGNTIVAVMNWNKIGIIPLLTISTTSSDSLTKIDKSISTFFIEYLRNRIVTLIFVTKWLRIL